MSNEKSACKNYREFLEVAKKKIDYCSRARGNPNSNFAVSEVYLSGCEWLHIKNSIYKGACEVEIKEKKQESWEKFLQRQESGKGKGWL